jgi:hypothetical protein
MTRLSERTLGLRSRSRLWSAVAYFPVLAAPALYVWYISAFGVNVPIQDTWDSNIPILQAFRTGRLTFALLWAPHTENRMLFPNLVLLLSDSLTHLDQKVDMYLGATFLIGAAILLGWLLRRTTGLHGIWLVPAGFLLFDLVQAQNALWAFQLAWMLTLFCLVGTLCLLELSPKSWPAFILACVVAVVGTYSVAQGLLLWPAGLIFLLALGPPVKRVGLWIGVGLATTALYFYNFGATPGASGPAYLLHHLVPALHFFLDSVGGISPVHPGLAGALMLAAGPFLVWMGRTRGVAWATLRVPTALWLSAVLFDLLVTEGRLSLGVPYALSSRYTTYNLLLAISLYCAAFTVATSAAGRENVRSFVSTSQVGAAVLALCVLGTALQLSWSIPNGLVVGGDYYSARREAAEVLLHYRTEPVRAFGTSIYGPNGSIVKQLAPVLARYHWSVFASTDGTG